MAYQDFNKVEEEKTSRINSAGLINANLETLWKEASNAMCSNNFTLWSRKLDAIWLILAGDVVEGDENDKKFKAIDLKIYSHGKLNHKPSGFQKRTDDDSESSAMQYVLLREKSVFLRRLQNSQGKGTAYANGDSDDFD